jgi:hypothetical protein
MSSRELGPFTEDHLRLTLELFLALLPTLEQDGVKPAINDFVRIAVEADLLGPDVYLVTDISDRWWYLCLIHPVVDNHFPVTLSLAKWTKLRGISLDVDADQGPAMTAEPMPGGRQYLLHLHGWGARFRWPSEIPAIFVRRISDVVAFIQTSIPLPDEPPKSK